jgi:5'/3'-nucleotidase
MRILISNDDGIYSPGILALAEVAGEFGQVMVFAPDVEQSAMGQAITIQHPLRYYRTPLADFEAYRVNGTPADCVALGLCQWEKADLVLSGINLGSNIGHEIWYSGTVAAARQAALVGVPAVGFSLALDEGEPDFSPLVPYVEQVLRLLQASPRPPLVNVNFPPKPQGVRFTRQSVRQHTNRVEAGTDPKGRPYYWVDDDPLTDPAEDTDRWAVEHGWASVTPLRLDLTDEAWLERISATS